MSLHFEWDERKAKQNVEKHGVLFTEAASIFGDPFSMTIDDPLHSVEERRFITVGESATGILLVVIHTDRNEIIRIISAREATRGEKQNYETG